MLHERFMAGLIGAVIVAAGGTALRAQDDACAVPQPRLTWPVDAGQGGARRGGETTLYAAALRVQPTLGIGCDRALSAAAVVAGSVIGDAGRALAGGSVAVRVARPSALLGLVSVPVFLSAEGLWGRGRRLVTGALTADASRALRVTLRAGRELDARRTVAEFALGTDLRRWVGPRGAPPRRPPAAGEFDDLDPFPRRAAVRMSVRASWLVDPGEERALDSARSVVDDAERVPNVDALRALLAARGPRRLVGTVDRALREAELDSRAEGAPVPPRDDPVVQRKLVVALVRGWRVAMRSR